MYLEFYFLIIKRVNIKLELLSIYFNYLMK